MSDVDSIVSIFFQKETDGIPPDMRIEPCCLCQVTSPELSPLLKIECLQLANVTCFCCFKLQMFLQSVNAMASTRKDELSVKELSKFQRSKRTGSKQVALPSSFIVVDDGCAHLSCRNQLPPPPTHSTNLSRAPLFLHSLEVSWIKHPHVPILGQC